MSPAKVVSAIVHFVNAGITMDRYYAPAGKEPVDLREAKAFWDENRRLCFTIGGKTYTFVLLDSAKETNP